MTKQEADVSRLRSKLGYIYEDYRKELVSRKYYGTRLYSFQNRNFWMEIIVALGTAGSVAGLAFFGTVPGRYVWLLVSGAAAVISATKPVLQHGKTIETYATIFAGHSDAYEELKYIVREVTVSKSLSAGLEERYKATQNVVRKLGHLAEPNQKKALMKRSEDEAKEEILPDSLWLPEAPQPPTQSKLSRLKLSVPLQAA